MPVTDRPFAPLAGRPSLRQALFNRRMLTCVFLGFASGLPLFILLNLLQAWLKTEGVSLRDIGLFALIQFPYTWKFVWSPLIDRYRVPGLARLGRRRGWMLATQLVVMGLVAALGQRDPKTELTTIAVLCASLAFFSASLDIVIDAFRRELLPDAELALGTAVYVNAYKLAGLVPGSLSLILADHLPWNLVFAITAAFTLPGIALVFFVDEPAASRTPPRSLRDAVVLPFAEFVSRDGWKQALLILAFIFVFKFGDSMATALSTAFYLDLGFTKTEVGVIGKNVGLWSSVVGGLIGGAWLVQARHRSRAVDLRRAATGRDLRLRVAREGGARPRGARVRDRLRGVRERGPRDRGIHRVHRAHHRPALHGDAVRAVHEPRRRTAHVRERGRGLPRRGDRLVRLLSDLRRARLARPAAAAEGRAVAKGGRAGARPHRRRGGRGGSMNFAMVRAGFARLVAASLLATAAAPPVASGQSLNVQLERQAAQQYRQLLDQARAKGALAPDGNADLQRLRRIQQRMLPFTYRVNPRAEQWQWEVNLLGSSQINAFCMPGGKIAFYSGIVTKLKLTDDEIAIVMGHEITHALKEHGVEQAKQQAYGELAARAGGALLSAWLGVNPNLTDLGARAANGLLQLRFSRGDETEADAIGLELAARAGYDPRAGVVLWQKMAQAAQGSPPQWLSSHPAGGNRIADIAKRMPTVLPLYAQAVGRPVDRLPPYPGARHHPR